MTSTNGSQSNVNSRINIPLNARDWRLDQLLLSGRLATVLDRMGCKRLGDLHGLTYGQVGETRACGRKTLEELASLISDLRANKVKVLPSASHKEQNGAIEPTTIFIPQHARGWGLGHMPFSVRLANVLRQKGVRLLGDLHGLAYDELLVEKNCGRQTIAELEQLVARLQTGEFDVAPKSGETRAAYLLRLIDEFIEKLTPRKKEVLLLRLGGMGHEPLTLEEVGERYGLTRERIRQIVRQILRRLLGNPKLSNALRELAGACLEKVCPLTPESLALWLGDSPQPRFPLPFYLRLLGELDAGIPAWADGKRAGGAISARHKLIIEVLRELLSDASSPSLEQACTALRARKGLATLTPGEMLEALRRARSLTVELSRWAPLAFRTVESAQA